MPFHSFALSTRNVRSALRSAPAPWLIALASLAAAGATHAQEISMYRFWASSQSLNPGQSAQVTIRIDLNPIIGTITPQGTILGLSGGAFNLNAAGAGSGTWTNIACDDPYNGSTSSPGVPMGASVASIIWATNPLLAGPHPSPVGADLIWTGTFTAGTSQGPVAFTVAPTTPVKIWVQPVTGSPVEIDFTGIFNDPAIINVVPAPSAALLLGLGTLLCSRRRR